MADNVGNVNITPADWGGADGSAWRGATTGRTHYMDEVDPFDGEPSNANPFDASPVPKARDLRSPAGANTDTQK